MSCAVKPKKRHCPKCAQGTRSRGHNFVHFKDNRGHSFYNNEGHHYHPSVLRTGHFVSRAYGPPIGLYVPTCNIKGTATPRWLPNRLMTKDMTRLLLWYTELAAVIDLCTTVVSEKLPIMVNPCHFANQRGNKKMHFPRTMSDHISIKSRKSDYDNWVSGIVVKIKAVFDVLWCPPYCIFSSISAIIVVCLIYTCTIYLWKANADTARYLP